MNDDDLNKRIFVALSILLMMLAIGLLIIVLRAQT